MIHYLGNNCRISSQQNTQHFIFFVGRQKRRPKGVEEEFIIVHYQSTKVEKSLAKVPMQRVLEGIQGLRHHCFCRESIPVVDHSDRKGSLPDFQVSPRREEGFMVNSCSGDTAERPLKIFHTIIRSALSKRPCTENKSRCLSLSS